MATAFLSLPPDLRIEHHGSIVLPVPVSDVRDQWLDAHIQAEAFRLAGAVASEPCYVSDIVFGARADGLRVAR
jgi:hypothetical protein